MWIVGDGDEEAHECTERWCERETRPPGTDVVRQAMRQRASEPPALGLGTARGGSQRRWSKKNQGSGAAAEGLSPQKTGGSGPGTHAQISITLII